MPVLTQSRVRVSPAALCHHLLHHLRLQCEHAADSEWNLWPMPRAWHELAAEQEMAWVAKTGTNSDRQTKRAGGGDDDDEEEEVEDMDTEQPSPKASKGKKRAA